ncbi:dihydrofolate reductase family protein [Spongisporangium articulatum]|uniref:Dihydrofolate reductase family protein n=1 Tax=Spongisporangium articulatum TaxID=3362603 RepID=A0ABW8AU24_9ACTN
MDFLGETISTQDAVLLGRRTYDKWAPHWPRSTMQPFADFINSATKYVFSSTQPALPWWGTTRVDRPAPAFVSELKGQDGKDIGVHGSLTLSRTLLAAGLVDELRLVVAPSLAGQGRRLFPDDAALHHFELLTCERSGGCLLLHYRMRRHQADVTWAGPDGR